MRSSDSGHNHVHNRDAQGIDLIYIHRHIWTRSRAKSITMILTVAYAQSVDVCMYASTRDQRAMLTRACPDESSLVLSLPGCQSQDFLTAAKSIKVKHDGKYPWLSLRSQSFVPRQSSALGSQVWLGLQHCLAQRYSRHLR